jgi:hypothetical protein
MANNGYVEAFAELSASESRILQFRMEHPGATQPEIAAGIGLSHRQVSRLMTRDPLRHAFADFSKHVLTAAVVRIKGASLVAVQTLVEIAEKTTAKDADRIQAARALLATLDGIGAFVAAAEEDDEDYAAQHKRVIFIVGKDGKEHNMVTSGPHGFEEEDPDPDDRSDA